MDRHKSSKEGEMGSGDSDDEFFNVKLPNTPTHIPEIKETKRQPSKKMYSPPRTKVTYDYKFDSSSDEESESTTKGRSYRTESKPIPSIADRRKDGSSKVKSSHYKAHEKVHKEIEPKVKSEVYGPQPESYGPKPESYGLKPESYGPATAPPVGPIVQTPIVGPTNQPVIPVVSPAGMMGMNQNMMPGSMNMMPGMNMQGMAGPNPMSGMIGNMPGMMGNQGNMMQGNMMGMTGNIGPSIINPSIQGNIMGMQSPMGNNMMGMPGNNMMMNPNMMQMANPVMMSSMMPNTGAMMGNMMNTPGSMMGNPNSMMGMNNMMGPGAMMGNHMNNPGAMMGNAGNMMNNLGNRMNQPMGKRFMGNQGVRGPPFANKNRPTHPGNFKWQPRHNRNFPPNVRTSGPPVNIVINRDPIGYGDIDDKKDVETSSTSSTESKSAASPTEVPNTFKNDGSFMEMFKKMKDEDHAEGSGTDKSKTGTDKGDSSSTIRKPPALLSGMVGKRRGGRVLKTGLVKKVKKVADPEEEKGPKDAWSMYMAEVKKYREASCEEEGKTRPLVK